MFRLMVVLLVGVVLQCGCVAQKIGNTLKYNVQGEYYLQSKEYQQGEEAFAKALRQSPENARARYFYGRFLLGTDKAKQALVHLQKAVALDPLNSDYHFWLGVAYGETGASADERRSYQRALTLDPDNVQAMVFLGNCQLKSGEYLQSLANYQKALELWPAHPQALYNRGVILRKLDRRPEEKLAWLIYLDYYPTGRFARLAADRLNLFEDYSYRNHRFGIRTVTLTKIDFFPFEAEIAHYSKPSLDLVGNIVANMDGKVLDILVYQLNNLELAKKRALAIRAYLYRNHPTLKQTKRIRLSWFDAPQVKVIQGKRLTIDESVDFFLSASAGKAPGRKAKKIKAKKKKML